MNSPKICSPRDQPRGDTSPIGDTIFRIVDRKYTCLADFALWLRLLSQGKLCYLARPLSFIRSHADQLQNSEEVAALCITERYYLTRDAREIGFLADDIEKTYQTLTERGVAFEQAPKKESWGTSAVFKDLVGNTFALSAKGLELLTLV